MNEPYVSVPKESQNGYIWRVLSIDHVVLRNSGVSIRRWTRRKLPHSSTSLMSELYYIIVDMIIVEFKKH